MNDEWGAPDPFARWPTLAERDAGTHIEPELYEGVPAHLERDLRDWVAVVLSEQPELARAVLNRFRVSWRDYGPRLTHAGVIDAVMADQAGDRVRSPQSLERLSIVDAIVGLHPYWGPNTAQADQERWVMQLVDLNLLLRDTGSAWHLLVDPPLRGLYRRVDPTAADAWKLARKTTEAAGAAAATANLAAAWHAIYGRSPDPSAGYSAAVKAVEAVAVPVLTPGIPNTVHAAARSLRKDLAKDASSWQFTLQDAPGIASGTGSAGVVSAMLDRLIIGETDRHTSGPHNRASTQPEAEAAIHLAVTLVQWFSAAAIRPQR